MLTKSAEILFKLTSISLMVYSFKLVDDILHLPLKIIVLMATSWQIVLTMIYLFISMIWQNNNDKPNKFDTYFGIIHSNALMMSFGVTFIFWSFFLIAQDLIIARSAGIPILYLHLQHTLPFGAMIIDLLIFKNYNRSYHQKGLKKYLLYSSLSPILYMVMIYAIHMILRQIRSRNWWPYPFMAGWSDIQYIIFCFGLIALFCILCIMQRWFHLFIVKARYKPKHE